MNDVILWTMSFSVSDDYLPSRWTITLTDSRHPAIPELGEIIAKLVSDTDSTTDNGAWNTKLNPLFRNTIHNVIKLLTTSYSTMVGHPFFSTLICMQQKIEIDSVQY